MGLWLLLDRFRETEEVEEFAGSMVLVSFSGSAGPGSDSSSEFIMLGLGEETEDEVEGELEEVIGLRFDCFSEDLAFLMTTGSGTLSPFRSCFELFFFPFSDLFLFPFSSLEEGEGSKMSDFLDFLGTEVLLGGNMFLVGIFPLFFSLLELPPLLELDFEDFEEDLKRTASEPEGLSTLLTKGDFEEDLEPFSLFDDPFSVLLLLFPLLPPLLSPNIFSDFPPPPFPGLLVLSLSSFEGPPVGVPLPVVDDVLVMSDDPLRLIVVGGPKRVSKEFFGLDFDPTFVLECFDDFPPPELDEACEEEEELAWEEET